MAKASNISRSKLDKELIRGTRLYIAYHDSPKGVSGFDEAFETLSNEANGIEVPSDDKHTMVTKPSFSIYKLPDAVRYEELFADPLSLKMTKLEYDFDITSNTKLDANGNLLLKENNAGLDKSNREGGNILINASGKVLRHENSNQMYIYPCDKNGYYLAVIFKHTKDNKTKVVKTSGIEYSFLDKTGKRVCKDNFTPRFDGSYDTLDRAYVDIDEKYFRSNGEFNIYPRSYIYHNADKKPPLLYFESALDFYIASKENPEDINIEGDNAILEDMYGREEYIDTLVEILGKKVDKYDIIPDQYKRAMALIDKEYTKYNNFHKKYDNKVGI